MQKQVLLQLLSRFSRVRLVRPHRRQPTRLPRPWDSPGKNTGVGCHFLLQCLKVESESEVAQSCLTLHDTMDYSLPGSSVHGIFRATVLEWGAIAFSLTPIRTALIKKKKKGNTGISNFEKQLLIQPLWKSLEVLQNVTALPCNQATPLLDIYPREIKTCPHNLYTNVYSSISHNSQRWKSKCLNIH